MPIGAAANELMTSISHASTPSARRRRERASRRSERVMGQAYPRDPTPSTLEQGSGRSRLAEAICNVILSLAFRLAMADGGKCTFKVILGEHDAAPIDAGHMPPIGCWLM